MPTPSAPPVVLTAELRHKLQLISRATSTPQALAFRSKLILRLADSDEPPNRDVAAEFGCSRNTVALWRTRFLGLGLAGLQDAPRSGRPRGFSPC